VELLRFVGLRTRETFAKNLPYGDQRRLEIARALASEPKLLLLDEPTAGMNPQETARLTRLIGRLRDERGISVLLIEHEMRVVMSISDRVTVLDHGEKISEGRPPRCARTRGLSRRTSAPRGRARRCAPRSREHPQLLRAHPRLERRLPDRRGGGDRNPDRLERRREDDDLALHTRDTAAERGRIVFRGEEIQGVPAHDMIEKGISQSPEGRKIFHRMTVLENLEMGAYHRNDRTEIQEDMTRVFDLFPRLKERVKQEAGTMSGGEQQMLAIGRSLMGRPRLLLLDEPSMGLAPVLVERIFQVIEEINKQGTTILLVEQNANVALEIATRGYVLETGTIVNAAPAEKLREDPKVREAYLGEI
jgi:branched-chain amino acid transport system ATP-binding protein